MMDIGKIIEYFSRHSDNIEEINRVVKLHSNMLLRWQRIANLIGLSDARDIAEFLYLDSFKAIKLVSEYLKMEGVKIEEISDIGSGAGFPSIFWFYFIPDARVILYEPKRKKANFLKDFIRIADLKNYSVIEEMVDKESLQTELIVSKAAININDWVRFGISNVRRGGVVVSLLTEESMRIYDRSVEKVGRVLKRDYVEYLLPYSQKRRIVGIIFKK
ncbi:MAG: RsmG family class I SAM-dependent methyltransferase [Myxococcota bacterium]